MVITGRLASATGGFAGAALVFFAPIVLNNPAGAVAVSLGCNSAENCARAFHLSFTASLSRAFYCSNRWASPKYGIMSAIISWSGHSIMPGTNDWYILP
ncbi:MAG: hypothetical protein ACLQF2_11925 [Rhodomicrobium sp.]